jgi:hypothetical protein
VRPARACTTLALALLLVAACGFSGKKEVADRIRSAPARLGSGKAQAVELRTSVRAIGALAAAPSQAQQPTPAPAGPAGQPAAAPRAGGLTTTGTLDYAARKAEITLPLGTSVEPFQILDGTSLYQRRFGGSSTQRPWIRLDLVDLYPDRQAQAGIGVGAQLITPVTIVDILRGTLSGSVRPDGEEAIGDTQTSRYRVNVDLEKAMDDASEPARRSFEAVRSLVGIKRLVQPGVVWLDAAGAIRRVQLTVKEERSRDEGVEVTFVMDLTDAASPPPITLPPDEQVSTVRDIQSLVAAVRPGSDR